MINSNDPRVKRTKQLIQQTFFELMNEKGFDAVTIQDIANRATINRSTFYAHYTDKYALLEELTILAFEEMIPEQIIQAQIFTNDICRQFVKLTNDYIIAFYQKCRFNNKSFTSQIDGKVKQILHQTVLSILNRSRADIDTNIIALMISSTIYSAVYCWYEDNRSDDIKQLSNTVTTFIMNGLKR